MLVSGKIISRLNLLKTSFRLIEEKSFKTMLSLGFKFNSNSSLFVLVLCLCICPLCSSTLSNSKIPAIFVFGDSLADTGNNNDMLTFSKCNFAPYGQNFSDQRATGRFSNGRVSSDFFAEEFGVKTHLPAYLDGSLKDEDLLTGVSFASGGMGFDPITCLTALAKSLDEQLQMFNEYIERVQNIVGNTQTNIILNNSIFLLLCGSNDVANTYFSTPFRRIDYDAESYSDFLVDSATKFVKNLLDLRVQKIVGVGLPPIGCVPMRRTLSGGIERACAKEENEFSMLFNSKLEKELKNLSPQFPSSEVVYFNFYDVVMDLILNHTFYGFEVIDRGCCGSGLVEVGVLCNSFSILCDVNKYFFWDSFHPTEKAYQIGVHKLVEKYFLYSSSF